MRAAADSDATTGTVLVHRAAPTTVHSAVTVRTTTTSTTAAHGRSLVMMVGRMRVVGMLRRTDGTVAHVGAVVVVVCRVVVGVVVEHATRTAITHLLLVMVWRWRLVAKRTQPTWYLRTQKTRDHTG